MNPYNIPSRSPRVLTLIGVTFGLAASLVSSPAADRTWNGGGDQSSWSDSANWGGSAVAAGDSLFFGGSTGLSPNNNLAANTSFAGLTFNSGAGAFTLGGNEINLGTAAGITNNSAPEQNIALAVNGVGAGRWYNAATGDLRFTGILRQAVNKIGSQTMWMQGSTGNSSVSLNVFGGTVVLANSAGNSVNSTVTVNTNGTLRITGAGTFTDQIHFNQRVIMNGGVFQLQHVDSVNTVRLEEIASLSGSNLNSIVECGLADSTNRLDIGGGNGHRGIYSGTIRDGAAGVLSFRVYRANNYEQLNGTNTYTGTTAVDNTQNSGAARLIVNGKHTGGGAYSVFGQASDATRLAYLHGNGIISASVLNVNARGFISPGGSLSADLTDAATFTDSTAILTISNAVNLNEATSTIEVQLNGTTPGSGYDQLAIEGSGTLSNNNANLQLTIGFTPATGDKFTIVKVPGTSPDNNLGVFASLNGVATDLSQGSTFVDPGTGKSLRISYRADGSTFDAGANGNDIMLEVVASTGANLTWRGDLSSVWNTSTANWRTAGNIATTFNNGDNVTFDNAGSNGSPVDLSGDLTPANLVANATKDYILATSGSGKLTGTVVLTKTNTGTLTIVTDNDNGGGNIINQGTVRVGTNGTTGRLSGNITVNPSGRLEYSHSDDFTVSTAISGSGAIVHTGNGSLILDGNSPFTGRVTNSGGVLQIGNGAASGSISGDVNVSGSRVLRYLYGADATLLNTKSGNGTAIYEAASGSRTYLIPGNVTNVNFSGSNYVAIGVRLHSADGNGGYNIGNGGSVLVENFSQVWLDRSATDYNQAFYLQGDGWTGDATPLGAMRIFGCNVSGPVTLLADTRIGGSINGGIISGQITGNHRLEVLGNVNSFILSLGPTNLVNTYGSTLVTSGAIRALTPGSISTGPLTVDLNGQVDVFGNNVTVANLNNGNNGAGVIYNNSTTTTGTLTVGTDNSTTSFDGVFGNGSTQPLNLTKVGSGTLTLSGISTNTGTVTVNGGTLALSGSGSFGSASRIMVGSGAFFDVSGIGGTLTLNSGQTLGGNGTVSGSVVASVGSIVSPGTSVGTISISGNLGLNGTLLMELNRAAGAQTNDLVAVSGSFTSTSGTLVVTNIGPALAQGNFFQLFSGGRSFASVILPTNDIINNVQYTWTNTIASNGRITVGSVTPIGGVNLPLAITNTSLVGTTLTLRGGVGTNNGPYSVRSNAAVNAPLGSWGVWATGNFGPNGNFSVSGTVPAGQRFFIIQQP